MTHRSRLSFLLLLAVLPPLSQAAEDTAESRARAAADSMISSGAAKALALGFVLPDAQSDTGYRTLFIGVGHPHDTSDETCDSQTLFEIGSVTKTFTGLVLADMVEHGQLALEDPAQKFLPESVHMPIRGDQAIRLVDLSDHASGLPRMPNNFKPADAANPYADYSADKLFEFLNNYKLRHAVGDRVAYSNVGVGLLGLLLERASHEPYEALVKTRICQPLDMPNTTVALTDDQKSKFAQGHDAEGNPVPAWDLNALVGAGGLRSNVDDLLKYVQAQLGLRSSPLDQAIHLTHEPRAASKGQSVGLGWHLSKDGDTLMHSGGTGGYRSHVAFRPHDKLGVIVLCNSTPTEFDEFGNLVLKIAQGIEAEPLKFHRQVEVPEDVLERYVGEFQLKDNSVFVITRDGANLFAQLSIQPKLRIWPESATKFFYRAVDAQIEFEVDAEDKCTALTLYQNGQVLKAPRIK